MEDIKKMYKKKAIAFVLLLAATFSLLFSVPRVYADVKIDFNWLEPNFSSWTSRESIVNEQELCFFTGNDNYVALTPFKMFVFVPDNFKNSSSFISFQTSELEQETYFYFDDLIFFGNLAIIDYSMFYKFKQYPDDITYVVYFETIGYSGDFLETTRMNYFAANVVNRYGLFSYNNDTLLTNIWVNRYNSGYDLGAFSISTSEYEKIYQEGYLSGIRNNSIQTYTDGEIAGYMSGIVDGYNSGFEDGVNLDAFGFFRTLTGGLKNVTDIVVLPGGFTFGYFLGISLAFGLIRFIVKLKKG
jgi:hypothetical protein